MTPAVTLFTGTEPNGRPVNKIVTLDDDGRLVKRRAKSTAYLARTFTLNGLADLREFLVTEVVDRVDRMVSFSTFVDPPCSEWAVWPSWRLAEAIKCDKGDREKLAGFHKVNGIWVAARIKESMRLNRFLLFDRDMADEMPDALADLVFPDWRLSIAVVWPGFDSCGLVRISSTSSRLTVDGAVKTSSSCHAIALVDDAGDVERAWAAATHRTLVSDFAPAPWDDPVRLAFRRSIRERKNGTGAFLRWSWWTVWDVSTWAVGREVFDGAPQSQHPRVGVLPGTVDLFEGPELRTSAVRDPTQAEERAIAAAHADLLGTGVRPTYSRETRIGTDGKPRFSRWVIHSADLEWDMDVDLGGGKWTTVREWAESGSQKDRCQTPFRDSDSMAAFLSRFNDGTPFLYDSGTGVNHTLKADSLDITQDIIRAWYVETYSPAFMCKDFTPYSSSHGKMTKIKPDSVILDKLKLAREAERDKLGRVITRKLTTLFNSFLPAAIGDLAKLIPWEGDDRAVTAQSADETRTLVSNLLAVADYDLALGYNGRRLSLASWALTVAEQAVNKDGLSSGKWRQVADLPLWGCLKSDGLMIAFKPQLAARMKCSPDIAAMTPGTLTKLCKAAGISPADINDNVIAVGNDTLRATVLTLEFVSSLTVVSARTDDSAHRLNEALANSPPPVGRSGNGVN